DAERFSEYVVDAAALAGGDEADRGPGCELQLPAQAPLPLLRRPGPLAHEVPLVADDDHAPQRFDGVADDVRVLRGEAFRHVEQAQRDIAALERAARPQRRMLLDARLDRPAPPEAGRIDQHEP